MFPLLIPMTHLAHGVELQKLPQYHEISQQTRSLNYEVCGLLLFFGSFEHRRRVATLPLGERCRSLRKTRTSTTACFPSYKSQYKKELLLYHTRVLSLISLKWIWRSQVTLPRTLDDKGTRTAQPYQFLLVLSTSPNYS